MILSTGSAFKMKRSFGALKGYGLMGFQKCVWQSTAIWEPLNPSSLKGTAFRPYIKAPIKLGALAPEGSFSRLLQFAFIFLLALAPEIARAQAHFDGNKAYEYARQFAAIGPRWPTGPGHVKAESYLRSYFQRNHDSLEEDTFTATTPIGQVPMRNFIARFPGKKPGIIVLSTHYETNYPLRTINFVGANDGAATTGLLMAIADQLRA